MGRTVSKGHDEEQNGKYQVENVQEHEERGKGNMKKETDTKRRSG